MTDSSAGPSGHIIVCGFDDVGLRTVEQLYLAGVQVVVEDDADARLVRVVRGSPRLIETMDEAGLSVPSLVESCLRTGTYQLDLDGHPFVVKQVVSDVSSRLRSRYGSLAPLAVTSAEGGEVVVCPGRDHAVHPGDLVTLFGTAEELALAGLDGEPGGPAPDRVDRLRDKWRLARSLISEVDRRLAFVASSRGYAVSRSP